MRSLAGCWRAALSPATASASGRPTARNGSLTQFATAKAGLVLVNINPAYRAAELEYALNKAGCGALVTASVFKASDYSACWRRSAGVARLPPGALAARACRCCAR